jgi:hypothetical protein
MDQLVGKISSYNLFNYLLPGTVFSLLADQITSISLIRENLFEAFFFYYFIGMVISRIGSLVIEPILRRARFVQFADYGQYIKASEEDDRIELLSEVSNTYRTISSALLLLLLLMVYDDLLVNPGNGFELINYSVLLFLFLLFIFSYRKQTTYITKRVRGE